MLSSVRNIFRVPDLRGKILFTLFIIALYRIGAFVPAPGIDLDAVQELKRQAESGGGVVGLPPAVLRRRAHPVRHLRPRDHAVHHGVDHHADPHRGDPEAGGVAADGGGGAAQDHAVDPLPRGHDRARCRPPAWRSSSTTAAAACSAVGATTPGSTCCPTSRRSAVIIVVLTLTAGLALLMWMGELISQRGIGNGMSLLIFSSVVSYVPRRRRPAQRREGHAVPHRPARPRGRAARRHRVHRAGPATHPGAVRQAGGGPAHVRRPEHLHPAQGEPDAA